MCVLDLTTTKLRKNHGCPTQYVHEAIAEALACERQHVHDTGVAFNTRNEYTVIEEGQVETSSLMTCARLKRFR